MSSDKIASNVRHQNKFLEFQTAEGVTASEILDKLGDATEEETEGPLIMKWRAFGDDPKEDELLAEGYPYTLFRWSGGDLVVEDGSGSVRINGEWISHGVGVHGMS